MNIRLLTLLLFLLLNANAPAEERIAMVREDGMLVFLPEAAGQGTYGTYLVPNALGREQLDRFVYEGNPVQINFLAGENFGRAFVRMEEKEKLQEFLRTESKHLTKAFGQPVEFTDLESFRAGGVDYLAGTSTVTAPDGKKLKMRVTARTAGSGILHAAYQESNRATLGKAQSMVDRLLRSFKLVNRPLTPDELTAISQKARD
jgi:hypothetical protein